MREFGFTIEAFNKGLRQYGRARLNHGTASVCLNMVPKSLGLIGYKFKIMPFNIIPTYPFPQIFHLKRYFLLFMKDAIYSVEADNTLTLKLDLSTEFNANPTWEYRTWDIADFYTYIIATNGSVMVQSDPDTGVFSIKPPTTSFPLLSTVVNYRGQIMGIPNQTWPV